MSSRSHQITGRITSLIEEKGIDDKVEVKLTGCHGFCQRGPIVIVEPEGTFYCSVSPDDAEEILEDHILKGKPLERLFYMDPVTGQKIQHYRDIPFYKEQERLILRNCGHINPESIDDYIGKSGYEALKKVLGSMSREDVIKEVTDSGIRGRGGAGFPTGLKWKFAHDAQGDEKYLICNADEGDPGAFMDRSVLEADPHSLIEGMVIAGYAIGARTSYIYVRKEYPLAILRLHIAIRQAKEMGFLGKDIMGSGFDFEIDIMEGAGAFVCGEETALIASIMGQRGMPHPRPPFPAQKGLWGKPTNINNVKTLASVPSIILNGAKWYSSIGTEGTKGTAVFALTGKIRNSGLVEVPMGVTLRKIIEDIGGGIPDGKGFKAVQTGGPSGGCLPESALDYVVDFESLKEAGTIMGSGGMIVMDEDTCIVDVAHYFISFTQEESCGKCSPCRIGTKQMLDILTRIKNGGSDQKDLDDLSQLAWTVSNGSLCALGQTAPNPVLTTLRYFMEEYEEHIFEKKCRAKVCKPLIKYTIDPVKCIGCGACERRCPVKAISPQGEMVTSIKGSKNEIRGIDPAVCIRCGLCIETCPPKVSAISRVSPIDDDPASKGGGGK
jgi:NADH:ubiquinone oxidoreductase subunit F (NADH-binding)/(2Fe-2S) ferredoxin/NAD-dependent dihydropyrimidine dehydrogenase PreA subunit